MEFVIKGLDNAPVETIINFADEMNADIYIADGKLVIERKANE